jgi:hypothetical protein
MASDKSEKTEHIDPFITMLDAKIAALQTLREGYLKALALGALGQEIHMGAGALAMTGYAPTVGIAIELPTGAFLNMSIPEAIRLYLSAVKKKQTAREIASALKEGGMESTAANWETTVTGALHRLKTAGAVLRFKDGWGLADHYPDSLRARIAKEKPRRGRPKRAKTAKAVKTRGLLLRPAPEAEEKAS